MRLDPLPPSLPSNQVVAALEPSEGLRALLMPWDRSGSHRNLSERGPLDEGRSLTRVGNSDARHLCQLPPRR